jgi:hypothetical protein
MRIQNPDDTPIREFALIPLSTSKEILKKLSFTVMCVTKRRKKKSLILCLFEEIRGLTPQ